MYIYTLEKKKKNNQKNNTVINKDSSVVTTEVLRAGRQAGTMLKGVCSWAHKLTHSTDVF